MLCYLIYTLYFIIIVIFIIHLTTSIYDWMPAWASAAPSGYGFSVRVWVLLNVKSSGSVFQPPSSRSSCFCGHRMSLRMTARIIMPKTKNHPATRRHVNTQPRMRMGWAPSKARATAKVAVYERVVRRKFPEFRSGRRKLTVRPVFGKMKEYQVKANWRRPCLTQDQCAPQETMKKKMARPQSHIPIQFAITTEITPAISPTPMKFSGMQPGKFCAMVITPAMVKPEGPTEMNMPGRRDSFGSF